MKDSVLVQRFKRPGFDCAHEENNDDYIKTKRCVFLNANTQWSPHVCGKAFYIHTSRMN